MYFSRYQNLSHLYQEGKEAISTETLAPSSWKSSSASSFGSLENTEVLSITCNNCGQPFIKHYDAKVVVVGVGGQVKPSELAAVLVNMPTVEALVIMVMTASSNHTTVLAVATSSLPTPSSQCWVCLG